MIGPVDTGRLAPRRDYSRPPSKQVDAIVGHVRKSVRLLCGPCS